MTTDDRDVGPGVEHDAPIRTFLSADVRRYAQRERPGGVSGVGPVGNVQIHPLGSLLLSRLWVQ